MEGSGPEKLLESVYGKNTVTHMSGKATSRALRGHFPVDPSLRLKLLASVCNQLCNGEMVVESVEYSSLASVKKKIDLQKEKMCRK